jgi:hypothetical protein
LVPGTKRVPISIQACGSSANSPALRGGRWFKSSRPDSAKPPLLLRFALRDRCARSPASIRQQPCLAEIGGVDRRRCRLASFRRYLQPRGRVFPCGRIPYSLQPIRAIKGGELPIFRSKSNPPREGREQSTMTLRVQYYLGGSGGGWRDVGAARLQGEDVSELGLQAVAQKGEFVGLYRVRPLEHPERGPERGYALYVVDVGGQIQRVGPQELAA